MSALVTEVRDLLEPRLAIGPRDGDVIEPGAARHQVPFLVTRSAVLVRLGHLGQRQIVMRHSALRVDPAVEAHVRPNPAGDLLQLGN
jgi:hypothetical protein